MPVIPRWFNQMRVGEETNFVASAQRLGSTLDLTDEFAETYDAFAETLRLTKDPPLNVVVMSFLFLATRYQYQKAVLECLRAHLTDSVQITRRAIECAAFAARVRKHPEYAELWRNAVDGVAEHQEFIKRFSGKALFPSDDPVLSELGKRYDYGSKIFHASLFSLLNRTRTKMEGEYFNMYFQIYEVSNDDLSEPAGTLLWILDTHLLVLGTFATAFKKQLGKHHVEVEMRLRELGSRLKAEAERWNVIQEEPGPAEGSPSGEQ